MKSTDVYKMIRKTTNLKWPALNALADFTKSQNLMFHMELRSILLLLLVANFEYVT